MSIQCETIAMSLCSSPATWAFMRRILQTAARLKRGFQNKSPFLSFPSFAFTILHTPFEITKETTTGTGTHGKCLL